MGFYSSKSLSSGQFEAVRVVSALLVFRWSGSALYCCAAERLSHGAALAGAARAPAAVFVVVANSNGLTVRAIRLV